MNRKTIIFMVVVLSLAVMVPIFADDISNTLNGTNTTNSSNNSISGNNSSNCTNNGTLTNTTNTTLTPEQLKTLTDTQTKLTALIATIESLKATYGNNTKAKGLLNALDQFEKQANKLNSEITAFIQNPTAGNCTIRSDINGRINSFVKREAALEHKVAIKQQLLAKQGTQGTNTNKCNNNSKNPTKHNNGHNNKGHNKGHNK